MSGLVTQSTPRRWTIALLGFAICVTPALAQRKPGQGVNFYSIEKEIALGKTLAGEMEKQFPVVGDPEIHEYVNRIGRELASGPDAAPYTYTFTLVRGEITGRLAESIFPLRSGKNEWLEPAALPGGFVFIPVRVLQVAESEAQFAGALAHAIAHIACRHGTRTATRNGIVGLATERLNAKVASTPGKTNMAIPLGFLQFARAFEREADSIAVAIMVQAGYDPAELVQFLERSAPTEAAASRTALSSASATHPAKQARIQAIQQDIQSIPERGYKPSSEQFERIKALVARLAEN